MCMCVRLCMCARACVLARVCACARCADTGGGGAIEPALFLDVEGTEGLGDVGLPVGAALPEQTSIVLFLPQMIPK